VRAAIAAAPDAPVIVRARAAVFLIALTDFLGDFEEARRLVVKADEVFRDLSDEHDLFERGELYYFLAFSSVETRHVDIALRQAENAIDLGTRYDLGWVAGAGRTVHAVARALRSFLADDLDAMVEAAQEAQRIARGWTRAWANAVLAETYLLHPDGPAAEALAATRTAVTVFHKQGDIPFALDAMMLGTLALAKLGRPADAVRLRSGIEAHAQLLGFQLATFLAPDAGWVDDILGGLPPSADGAQLTWADLVDLLSLHDD
jgi:tetratricopeptide (TPR) repeat protein